MFMHKAPVASTHSMAMHATSAGQVGPVRLISQLSRRTTCMVRAATAKAPPPDSRKVTYGIFLGSGSPSVAEGLSHAGVDWLCLDAQHSPMGYSQLGSMLQAMASAPRTRGIVRVGGPGDRYGIQQALDLGAHGIMVPLVNTPEEAKQAYAACKYPPEGVRSVGYPTRACITQVGAGGRNLSKYLGQANSNVQVWLQVETPEAVENLDAMLQAVPKVDCIFLGPGDMVISSGLHTAKYNGDLAKALAGPEILAVHQKVVQACQRHGVIAGTFCTGAAQAAEWGKQGFGHVGFDVDLNVLISYASAAMRQLRA